MKWLLGWIHTWPFINEKCFSLFCLSKRQVTQQDSGARSWGQVNAGGEEKGSRYRGGRFGWGSQTWKLVGVGVGSPQQRSGYVQNTQQRTMSTCDHTGIWSRACLHGNERNPVCLLFSPRNPMYKEMKRKLKNNHCCVVCIYFSSPYPFWEVVMTWSYNVLTHRAL